MYGLAGLGLLGDVDLLVLIVGIFVLTCWYFIVGALMLYVGFVLFVVLVVDFGCLFCLLVRGFSLLCLFCYLLLDLFFDLGVGLTIRLCFLGSLLILLVVFILFDVCL